MKNILEFLSRLWFPLFILLLIIILTIQFSVAQDVEIQKSKRLLDIDQPKKAIAELAKVAEAYPTNAAAWYHLGAAQQKNGHPDEAIKSFEKGISVDEKEPLNYVGKGAVKAFQKLPSEAKTLFDKALSMSKSKNKLVLQAIAESYLTDEKLVSEALNLLLKAKSLDDHDPETFLLLGDAYLAQNNGGLAVSSYERAASLNTTLAKPYYKIGLVYLRSTNFAASQEAFNKAIEIDPAYTLAYKEQGELYYQMKEGAKAVKAYETYLSLTENPEVNKLRYAFILFMAKDFAKANQVFDKLVQKPDATPVTLRYYAFSLFEAGDYPRSQNIFDRYFTMIPQQEIAASDYAYYGKLLLKENKDSLASINLQKSLSLQSDQPEILQLQAETYFKSKKYTEAIATYKRLMATRSKPLSQDYYTLGRAYYLNKQFESADTVFQKLIELQPAMTVGYLWEARVKSNLDPESEDGLAKPYYEQLIEKASASPEKSKNDLLEAYSYLGYYHFLKQEIPVSKSYWQKVLQLNPNDEKAKEALKAIH